jgi:hypothetical protein
MRIIQIAQGQNTVTMRVWLNPDNGKPMIDVFDQGIKVGCHELEKMFPGGKMDHSGSRDYQEELRRKTQEVPQPPKTQQLPYNYDEEEEQLGNK